MKDPRSPPVRKLVREVLSFAWQLIWVLGPGLAGLRLFYRWAGPTLIERLHADRSLPGVAVYGVGLILALCVGMFIGTGIWLLTLRPFISHEAMRRSLSEGGRIPFFTSTCERLADLVYYRSRTS